jgi:hypothetical protein
MIVETGSGRVTRIPKRKICKNCKENRPSHAFYQSKKSRDGLTSLCKKCGFVSDNDSQYSKDLFKELRDFESHTGRKAPRIRREIGKFDTEFRSRHWEPAVLALGRICEANVFELAGRLKVSIEFPTISYLDQLQQAHDNISEKLRELLAGLVPYEHQQKKLREDARELIDNTISFGFDLETLVGASTDQSSMDNNFAIKGIKKHILRDNTKATVKLFKEEFEPLYREVMRSRNTAAHAPREPSATLWKKDIRALQPKVTRLISISSELVPSQSD